MRYVFIILLALSTLDLQAKSTALPTQLEQGFMDIKKNQHSQAVSKWGEISHTHEDYIPTLSGELSRLNNSGQKLLSWEMIDRHHISESLQKVTYILNYSIKPVLITFTIYTPSSKSKTSILSIRLERNLERISMEQSFP